MFQLMLLCALGYPDASDVSVEYVPMFVSVPAVRTTSTARGELLRDIDMRLPKGHIYSSHNPITWAHETTHGVNNEVRNAYMRGETIKYNAFYVPGGQAALVMEPAGTIKQVADKTPKSLRLLRESTYALYISGKARSSWNNRPLNICDEWIAYTNGTAIRNELNIDNDVTVENMVYMGTMTLVMLYSLEPQDIQLQSFVAWNWERSMQLRAETGNPELGEETLLVLKHSADCAELRKYMKDYFGEVWVSEIFGF